MLSPALQLDCRPAWISFLTSSNNARSALLQVNWHQPHARCHPPTAPPGHIFLLVHIYTTTTLWSSIWLFSRLPQLFYCVGAEIWHSGGVLDCLLPRRFYFVDIWAQLWNYGLMMPRSSILLVLRKDKFSLNEKIIISMKLGRGEDAA